ncbi:decaprenyl-phosphate phosphoribosyltransferase [Actinopolymorpha alba]|uniref:decaprenyl-phosphate phosphoribosyltransferase n=1 Tax=Actinopolymorpha alba TaxID=533267 RepID=UPI00039AAC51|nr:decaprenyl-phosphate phosphoribosyltransferase [Actinopolymorpha alba]
MTTTATRPATAHRPAMARAVGLVRTCRPRQWIKNVLVLAAPASAGVLTQGAAVLDVTLAFVAFCLAASGTYLINDARDAAADRAHPRKKHRPVAAGVVPVPLAYAWGVAGLLASVALSFLTGSGYLAVVIAAYVLLTTAYSLWLKHVAILDLVSVAGGFVLRAVAGAAAVGVSVSSWFLIVATLGSLFVVAGKREAELRNGERGDSRATLRLYTREFLSYVRATTSGALLVSYCLWAFELHEGLSRLAFGLSIVPFAVGILRYAMLIDAGAGEAPEEIVVKDRMLLMSGLLLACCLTVGVYVV